MHAPHSTIGIGLDYLHKIGGDQSPLHMSIYVPAAQSEKWPNFAKVRSICLLNDEEVLFEDKTFI